jgi:methyltransferase-like protein
VSERPRASPVARFQTQDGTVVTNLWHKRVRLDPLQRHLLRHLDGTRDQTALLSDLASLVTEGVLTVQQEGEPVEDSHMTRTILGQGLEQHLHILAQAALLVG